MLSGSLKITSGKIIFLIGVFCLFFINVAVDLSHVGLVFRRATKEESIVFFILLNLTLAASYICFRKANINYTPWFFLLLVCVYGFNNTDYFSFGNEFCLGLEDFKDPLYKFILYVSFDRYSIFRMIIWGLASYFYYKTLRRFKINPNIGIFVIVSTYILLFYYARAVLAMSLYFYGLTFLIIKDVSKTKRLVLTILFFVLAFLAHRSMLVPILMTPIIFVKFNRLTIILLVCIIPLLSILVFNIIESYIAVDDDSQFGKSVQTYLSSDRSVSSSLAYQILTWMQKGILYVSTLVLIWLCYFKKKKSKTIPRWIYRYTNITVAIVILSLVFSLNSANYGLEIVAYRFLYMTGIPIAIVFSYLYQKREISNYLFYPIVLIGIIQAELLSFSHL